MTRWFWQTISSCRHCLKSMVHALAIDVKKKPAPGTMIKIFYNYQWYFHDMKGNVQDFIHQPYWWMIGQALLGSMSGMICELDSNKI